MMAEWVASFVAHFWEEFKEANKVTRVVNPVSNVNCRPLLYSVLKLNVDSACFSNLESGGLGAVLRDGVGKVWFGVSLFNARVLDATSTKELTIFKAVEAMLEAGFWALVVDSDAQVIILYLRS